MPLWPYFLNANGDRISAPVLRSVAMVPPGSGWPWYLSSIGLGSKLSTCDSPPFMNRKIDVLGARGMMQPAGSACRLLIEAGGGQRFADQAGKRQHAEAVAHAAQRFAAGDGCGSSIVCSASPGQTRTNRNSFELSSTLM